MRAKQGHLGVMTEYSLLMAKLNICSFGLNQATRVRSPEATQLRLSAYGCSTRLLQSFVATPFATAQEDGSNARPSFPVQTYYPRAYWRSLGNTCLILMKLSLTNSLPEPETVASGVAIQQVLDLLSACSTEDGDELYRISKLIRLLGHEAVQEIIKPRNQVNSRMGASLMYEIVQSATLWTKQKATERREERSNLPNDNSLIDYSSGFDPGFSMADLSPHAMDELIASSGYLFEGMGPTGFDDSFWDTSLFDQYAIDAAGDVSYANPAPS
ncbi:hypothetical protein LTR85_000380 [Meristemomyces frigidus]|nr:hypothetical protein LTR85_000380 [Meristemomyces frigidus]